ncbi:hypothetical protein C2845_PM01G25640 [Panicum miliaceum]|uniref:Uncharacterized protein n=1 Tax=Panicum miliaceum TaxID=4540 RepID=A0A3L6TQA8_PANMI|nr:hypothetical protein C2845_PM01G25640 [Panicum miliaceum]
MDLSRGLAYCDLRAAGNPAVEFDFIDLTYGYEILFDDLLPADEMTEPPEMKRTIGCIGGCEFICIDLPRGTPAAIWWGRGLWTWAARSGSPRGQEPERGSALGACRRPRPQG